MAVVNAPATGNRTQIETWPDEFIEFVEDDPRPFIVQAEMSLHTGWHLFGYRRSIRWAMGNGRHTNDGLPGLTPIDGHDDHAWAILPAFLQTAFVFVGPEKRIRYDQT
jgi:hypothetical protein